MDLILGKFADESLASLSEHEIELYDALLSENDHDLYLWVSGQSPTPARYLELISRIAAQGPAGV